ncbi:MAG: GAF domain-containing sensor histidine kinase [Bacteroidota bacterium]
MSSFPVPDNENDRLRALESYQIMDTLPEIDLDELTQLASELCQTPVALVSLLDDHRQWFKSQFGIDAKETPKEQAFCSHAILKPKETMVIEDARIDQRFSLNPLVTGDPNIVFYAGVPLVNDDGFALGTLCVIDTMPRQLTDGQIKSLNILAKQVLNQLELRRKVVELERANNVLKENNAFIRDFALSAAHDIKNPLTSMLMTSQLLRAELEKSGSPKGIRLVDMGINSAKRLTELVNSMLDYSLKPSLLMSAHAEFTLDELFTKICSLVNPDEKATINWAKNDQVVVCSAIALEQIFLNLLTNAIRYNDKAKVLIDIEFEESADFYHFKVRDNGIGIEAEDKKKIFEKHATLDVTDRFKEKGTGIGLANVKGLIEKLSGKIEVESTVGEGTTFSFSISKKPLQAD